MTQRSMRQAARNNPFPMRPALFAAAALIALMMAPMPALAQLDHLDPEYADAPEPAPKPKPVPAPAPAKTDTSEAAATPEPARQATPAPKRAAIHPNCILDVMPTWSGGDSSPRSLERCEAENRDIKYETTESGMILLERGAKNGYFAYHPVYEDNDRMVVLVYENTGGTGTFSYLADVRFAQGAEGKTSYQGGHAFGGGDRCENGIDSVTNPPGTKTLLIKSDITPSSLFEISKNPAYAQRAGNRDLPFCSYCCAGEATYQYEVGSTESPKLVSLHFDPQKIRDMSDQTNIDCFLKVLQNNPYVKDSTITPDKSDAVLKNFLDTCTR